MFIADKEFARELKLVAEPNTGYIKSKIRTSLQAKEYALQFYQTDIEIYESAYMVMLNRQCQTIGHVKLSQGGIVGTIMDTTLIAKYAIESLAKYVILVHNHPSGNLRASQEDINLTKKAQAALALFSIVLMDHVIITADGHTSLADEGIIQ